MTTLSVVAIWTAFFYWSYKYRSEQYRDMKRGEVERGFEQKESLRNVLGRLFKKWRKQFKKQSKSIQAIELQPFQRVHELEAPQNTFFLNLSQQQDDSRDMPTMVYEGKVNNPILPPDILDNAEEKQKQPEKLDEGSTRIATIKKTKKIKRNSKTYRIYQFRLRGRMEHRESLKKLYKLADEFTQNMLQQYRNSTLEHSKFRTVQMEGLEPYDPFEVEEVENWLDMSSQQA